MLQIGPMTPTLCHLNSTFNTALSQDTDILFQKFLKGDHVLKHQVFPLVREGTVATKKQSTKPKLLYMEFDWGAQKHSQALLLFPTSIVETLAHRIYPNITEQIFTCRIWHAVTRPS